MTKEYPWGKGTPKFTFDNTANDSSKDYTVPTGKIWIIRLIHVKLVATATVGNRILKVRILDGSSNVIWDSQTTGAIAATQTGKLTLMSCGITYSASGIPEANTGVVVPIPDIVLTAGYVLRIHDYVAVDAAADDMDVVLHYIEYDA